MRRQVAIMIYYTVILTLWLALFPIAAGFAAGALMPGVPVTDRSKRELLATFAGVYILTAAFLTWLALP